MKDISRFVQISDVCLLEYRINKEYDNAYSPDEEGMLRPGDGSKVFTLPDGSVLFADARYASNTALPTDKSGKEWCNPLDGTAPSLADFTDSYSSIFDPLASVDAPSESVPADRIRIYVVNGYSFSNTYGFWIKAWLDRETTDRDGAAARSEAVLLSWTYNRANARWKYVTRPLFFSNRVYDKYIELDFPSAQFLTHSNSSALAAALGVKEGAGALRLTYADLYQDVYTEHSDVMTGGLAALTGKTAPKARTGEFGTGNAVSTSLPLAANTDRFNLYIGESPKGGYIEYYGTWDGKALTPAIVGRFNVTIPLYTPSKSAYDAARASSGLEEWQTWYVQHGLKVTLVNQDGENVVLDNIVNTQYFGDGSPTRFYYRPIPSRLTESGIKLSDDWIMTVEYECSLVNVVDGSKVTRSGSMSTDLSKYMSDTGSDLNFSDTFTYKIFNRINNVKQELTAAGNGPSVKYTKVFYDSTTVNLSGNTGLYTMALANSPKNYKFTFTQDDSDGATKYMNFTGSYYKLYSRDKDGRDIYIDATYSDNMNTIMGELEFYIPQTMITRLKAVPVESRFMDIVVVNQDNTISTLYEFTYS